MPPDIGFNIFSAIQEQVSRTLELALRGYVFSRSPA